MMLGASDCCLCLGKAFPEVRRLLTALCLGTPIDVGGLLMALCLAIPADIEGCRMPYPCLGPPQC